MRTYVSGQHAVLYIPHCGCIIVTRRPSPAIERVGEEAGDPRGSHAWNGWATYAYHAHSVLA